jgi:FSR family fosmidomycin resistance protein-like MFS transporter
MVRSINKTNIKAIFALTLVQFTGDFYSSFSIPLIPEFVEKLSLSMVQVGILTGIMRFLAFIVQPSVGYLADRYQTRVFALGGLCLTVFFVPMSGLAPSYWLLIAFLSLGSFGSSMFHPSVTGMVPVYGGHNTGFSMSIFNTGGTLAFGVGPIFIAWYVAKFGLSAMPLTMLIGMIVFLYIYRVLPIPQSEGFRYLGFWGSLKEMLGHVWKLLLLIWVVMFLRSAVGQSFLTFMPVLLSERGYSLVAIGFITSIFIVAGTLSGLLTGYLSDRIEFRTIFYVTHLLMVPALLLLLYVHGDWVYLLSALAGFFVLATMPISVVMAQELAPKGRSMVASLMMGFAYGLGGALTPITGKLADISSIPTVLLYVSLLPLLTLIFIFYFPSVRVK